MKNRLISVLENTIIVILFIIIFILAVFIGTIYVFYLCVSIPLDIITLPLVLILWIITGKWFTFTLTKLPLNLFDIILKRLK